MRSFGACFSAAFFCTLLISALGAQSDSPVKVWEETLTIPTYEWGEDVNPKFWALEGAVKGSTTVKGSIVYPYTMQDFLTREKKDRVYSAIFLENEYLKIACLPELGGRLYSVFDKVKGEEVFHFNRVVKPSMIAMRGGFITGGVEWNAGPQVHTVTILSPVNVLAGRNADGSGFLEVSNLEKSLRTRWTVRVTLHPGRSYLDEEIRIFNPTDAMSPYYFWNCTSFPNRPGTRFIYPMTLGTDHHGIKFFSWPVHEGKDLSWLKNYDQWASIFAYQCEFDFFGAYDVDKDRGVVQVADHHELSGKKAWTWGNWEFGLVSQKNLTDEDGPYIEVQSGPLPTQSDYGMLAPREEVSWQEWWYPVHGLGDGFEYATKDVAVQSRREGEGLQLRFLATGKFPAAVCSVCRESSVLLKKRLDLSPEGPQEVALSGAGSETVEVILRANDGQVLASFSTPLPIPKASPPDPSRFAEKPDAQLSVEEKFLKGLKYDRAMDRKMARKYYEMALEEDPGHVRSLRGLAVLDIEAGLYERAINRLEKALERTPHDDGLSRYFLGVGHLKRGEAKEALSCAGKAVRCFGTFSLGYDLAGRAAMRLGDYSKAQEAFAKAVESNPKDTLARDHLLLSLYAAGETRKAIEEAQKRVTRNPSDLVPRALLAIQGKNEMDRFAREARAFVGEDDFEFLETSLVFADLGLLDEASRVLFAGTIEAVPEGDRSPLPLYYLGYFASLQGEKEKGREFLHQAARIYRDFVFPSRPEAEPVLVHAVQENPGDAYAHLHLGNLYGNFGRLEEAVSHWTRACQLDASLSIAFRNLGLYSWAVENDLEEAGSLYRKAIAARSADQTLYRDLAEILMANRKQPEAIELLESMPYEKERRGDVLILLAQAYLREKRFTEAIELLETTPYFVVWEGSAVSWELFHRAHLERGKNRFERGDFQGALQDFEAALTYPENLGVGRKDKPEEAHALFWKGKALQALGRIEEARAAWRAGAAGYEGSKEQNTYREECRKILLERK